MKTIIFIAITLLAGAIAGTILGAINQVAVEPYIDRAVELETHNANQSSQIINSAEFTAYRLWQRGGEIVAGTILGLSIGSLFGIVFAYTHSSVPGSNNKKKALIVAGIMWFVLFLMPALKYPANPPAVGDPETIYYRQSLYVAFLAISGFSALGLAFLYRKMGALNIKKAIIPVAYAAIISGAYLAMPANPDPINAPMDLVMGFRITSAITISMFWGLLGVIFGTFWDKLNPSETARISVR
ncbi:MAG: CbtA family protein [Thermoproteota archaeon]|jgi:predicted cobalt transporter CbtA|nr:CbtA family protein [Thermoproteota archaeon]MDQ4018163.1 CbtA family protein [Thermoproteota archaeon]